MITIPDLKSAAQAILELSANYSGGPDREMRIDRLAYAVLSERFGVSRQHSVNGGRIDFRQEGVNPVVVELVVRTPQHGNQIYGSQNSGELRKLAKETQMKMRYLLLLDLCPSPIEQPRLMDTYAGLSAGPGRFDRASVRVIYAHPREQYDFLWQP
jgi:hypothetical protein